MIQDVLTFIAVSASIIYVFVGIWKIIFADEGDSLCVKSCGMGCSLRKELAELAAKQKDIKSRNISHQ